MVENNFVDDVADQTAETKAQSLANIRALQALQAEIDYHRKHEENGTYVDKALSLFPFASNSLDHLERLYENELENPTMSEKEIIDAVKHDQSVLSTQGTLNSLISGAAKLGFALSGRRFGAAASLATFALDTMHPNHSFGEQVLEGVVGVGLGRISGSILKYGLKSPDPLLGPLAAGTPYWLSHGITGNLLHKLGPAPDPKAILNLPLLAGEQPASKPEFEPMPDILTPPVVQEPGFDPADLQILKKEPVAEYVSVAEYEPIPNMPDLIAPQGF